MKKLLYVIAPEKFRDEEYTVPFQKFQDKGFQVTITSTKMGTCRGMFGTSVTVENQLEKQKAEDYDGIVIAGGQGTPLLRASEALVKLVQEFANKDKLVAAICWAPTILAKAGVLKGREATVWQGDDIEEYAGKKTSEVLESYGAKYTGNDVTVSDNYITGNGPAASSKFGEAIINKLTL
jgi:protease I